MIYRYYSPMRPIGPGTFPKKPELVTICNFDYREWIKSIGKYAWGFLEYTKPLSNKETKDYELILDN